MRGFLERESLLEEKLGMNLRGNMEKAFPLKFRLRCPNKFIQGRNPPKPFQYPHNFTEEMHNHSHGGGEEEHALLAFSMFFSEVSLRHC